MTAIVTFLVPCRIILLGSVPLMLQLVPPNRYFGFRTQRTLADRALWFRVNRFAGCACFVAAGASASVFLVEPEFASGRSFAGLAIFLVPLATAVAASFAYLRRLGARVPRP